MPTLRPAPGRLPVTLAAVALCLLALTVASCGTDEDATAGSDPTGFAEARRAADGTTVRWWMFGGDARINAYVDSEVVPAAQRLGIDLERVPVADTAAAVQRVIAQRRAGQTDGGKVDLIWINGENFAAGKEAGLWLEDWVEGLPNVALVDLDDPSINEDLGVPVDGQEAPWSRAAFVYATDSARVPDPPQSFDELLAYATDNPGRVTYPAPPDFTGTSFVKQAVIAMGEDEAFAYLEELKPLMWEGGEKLPKSEAELNELFANGEVDFAMSFDPSFVASAVEAGQFPSSTRPFLLEGGALVNTSYVTIPDDAANLAGAQVVANLLLSPRLQAIKADPRKLGIPTVLDRSKLDSSQRRPFETNPESPYLLDDFGQTKEELPAAEVVPLEERWQREILR